MLQLGIGADGFQEFHLLFDILTCQLSRCYCMIGRETSTHARTCAQIHTCARTHLGPKAQAITVNSL